MISAFRVRPAVSGRGLCGIDGVYTGVYTVTTGRTRNPEIIESLLDKGR